MPVKYLRDCCFSWYLWWCLRWDAGQRVQASRRLVSFQCISDNLRIDWAKQAGCTLLSFQRKTCHHSLIVHCRSVLEESRGIFYRFGQWLFLHNCTQRWDTSRHRKVSDRSCCQGISWAVCSWFSGHSRWIHRRCSSLRLRIFFFTGWERGRSKDCRSVSWRVWDGGNFRKIINCWLDRSGMTPVSCSLGLLQARWSF